MPLPRECQYESPHSRLQFILHLAELHAALAFFVTIFSTYLLWTRISTYTAFLALAIGAIMTFHMARGGRSFVVSAHLDRYQQYLQQTSSHQSTQTPSQQSQLASTNPSNPPSQQQQQQQQQQVDGQGQYVEKVAVITGSSSGLGFATAQLCMKIGIHVIFAVRNVAKMSQQLQSLKHNTPREDQYTILQLDLDDLSTIPIFVENFTKLNKFNGRLDYLINNAGAMVTSQKLIKVAPVLATRGNDGGYTYTPIDGDKLPSATQPNTHSIPTTSSSNETATAATSTTTSQQSLSGITKSSQNEHIITHIDNSFSTNHLGHFLLTILFLPQILKYNTRIINVTSAIHVSVKQSMPVIDCLMADSAKWDALTAYANTKICNIWFTQALQRRLDHITQHSTPITTNNLNNPNAITLPSVFAVHPGTIWSPFHMPYYLDTAGGSLLWFPIIASPLARASFKTTTQASLTTLHCCLGRSNDLVDDVHEVPEVGPQPGQFHADCRVTAMSPVAAIEAKQEDLWELSLLLCRRYVNASNFPLYNSIQ